MYPLGELDHKVVFLKEDLNRNCKKGVGIGEENEFWLYGKADIVIQSRGTLKILIPIDTINVRECKYTIKEYA